MLVIALSVGCDRGAVPGEPEAVRDEMLERITRPVEGRQVHLVGLAQRGDRYAFEPDEVSIASGDVVRFVMAGAQPESVAFDPVAATPAAGAYIRDNALHQGTLLTDPGQAYDVSFRDAPPGRYPFLSRLHAASGMRGVVVVRE